MRFMMIMIPGVYNKPVAPEPKSDGRSTPVESRSCARRSRVPLLLENLQHSLLNQARQPGAAASAAMLRRAGPFFRAVQGPCCSPGHRRLGNWRCGRQTPIRCSDFLSRGRAQDSPWSPGVFLIGRWNRRRVPVRRVASQGKPASIVPYQGDRSWPADVLAAQRRSWNESRTPRCRAPSASAPAKIRLGPLQRQGQSARSSGPP